jgi:hypothetical protein
MCRKMTSLVSIIFVLAFASAVQGTDYYVSPTGDDGAAGTSPSTAWQTISKVNSVSFSAGDSISFEAGETFTGSLYFDAGDAGTATNPVTVGSYGSGGDGRAMISSGTSDGLYAYDCGGFDVTDLKFIGSGYSVPGGYGVRFYTDRTDGVKLERVYIDNLDVSGYYEVGIKVSANDDSLSGFRDVRITNCISHDNGDKGINTEGVWPPQDPAHSLEDVYVGDCVAYNNFGIPGREPHTGNGIILSGITNAIIEFCESYNNGELDDTGGGGPIGIWYWEVHNGIIQYSYSHDNKSAPNTKDGGGFDLDGGCINCIVQYNYSHDNHGSGIGVFQFRGASTFRDNIVRYNIFQNDGHKRHGLIDFWAAGGGKVENTDVYNNTLYVGPDTVEAAFFRVTSGSKIPNTRIFNNIILTVPGKACADIGSGVTFQGNCYWSGGGPLNINGYTSLAAGQATGQEMLDGQPVGYETDPKLVNPGGSSDTDYQLQSSSPMINGGLDLPVEFGLDVGSQDYFGNSIPQDGAYDVGAYEGSGEATPTPTPTPTPTGTPTPTPTPSPTPTGTPDSLFSDGFESGDFVAGGWTPVEIARISRKAAYTGTYGTELRNYGSIEKAVSTSGYTNIHLKYARTTNSLEAGELLYAEWWDGGDWNVVESTNDESWVVQDWALPAAASNNASFKIRFRLSADHGANDQGRIDDVEVTGQ